MFRDVIDSAGSWRLIHLLGLTSLRGRYARSRLGQTWLTVANFIFIIAIGIVWAKIWSMDIDEYLPYVGVGQIIYTLLAGAITESPGVLVGDVRIFMNERRPFLISIFAHIYRHLLILLHNIPIIVGLILWSNKAHLSIDWLFVPATVLNLLFITFISYALALVCARFRDLGQIVNVIMQVSFLLTPVMWQMKFLPEHLRGYFFIFNPLAAGLEILRNPIIGFPVADIAYYSMLGWTLLSFIAAVLAHKVYGRKIIFWL